MADQFPVASIGDTDDDFDDRSDNDHDWVDDEYDICDEFDGLLDNTLPSD